MSDLEVVDNWLDDTLKYYRKEHVDNRIAELKAELAEARRLLHRYRTETPIGNQPHTIVGEVDKLLAATGGGKDGEG